MSVTSSAEGARLFHWWRQDRESAEAGPFDVIEIAGIDVTPCDGSHVARTGKVGHSHDISQNDGVYRLTAERTSTWMYRFGEKALIDFDWDALHTRRVSRAI